MVLKLLGATNLARVIHQVRKSALPSVIFIDSLSTRSQYPSVVKRRYGPRIRFSKNRAFLMGNRKSHLGKQCP